MSFCISRSRSWELSANPSLLWEVALFFIHACFSDVDTAVWVPESNIDHRLDNVEGSLTPPTHLTSNAVLASFERNGTVLQRVFVQSWLDRTPSYDYLRSALERRTMSCRSESEAAMPLTSNAYSNGWMKCIEGVLGHKLDAEGASHCSAMIFPFSSTISLQPLSRQ